MASNDKNPLNLFGFRMFSFLFGYECCRCSGALVSSIKQWSPLQSALGGQCTVCGLSYLPLVYTFLQLEINWVNYQVKEEKKTCPESGKEWLLWVIKDLGLNTVLVTCEEGASDVNGTDDYWGSWALSENRRGLPGCAWFAWTGASCFLLSASTHLSLSFDLHFRRWHVGYLWPVSDHDMTCNLSFTANTQKLSADWQSSHCLLNLSACVILSNAFFSKKVTPLWQPLLSAAIFLQELEERKRRKTVSLGISGFDNLSLTILSWGLL